MVGGNGFGGRGNTAGCLSKAHRTLVVSIQPEQGSLAAEAASQTQKPLCERRNEHVKDTPTRYVIFHNTAAGPTDHGTEPLPQRFPRHQEVHSGSGPANNTGTMVETGSVQHTATLVEPIRVTRFSQALYRAPGTISGTRHYRGTTTIPAPHDRGGEER